DFARIHGIIPEGAFAIVAMGRLGSREMTLASDLDLILIYDAPAESILSNGPRPLALSDYYARLSQRLISAITAPTAEGRLFDVADMRRRIAGSVPSPSAWDLRNRRGGLVDLEFIAQYLMLREAVRLPHVLQRDTASALRALGDAHMLTLQAARELSEAGVLL